MSLTFTTTVPSSQLDLSAYGAIETGLFCRIECAYYKTSPSSSPTSQTLLFSNYNLPVTINGDTYQPLGQLLDVSASNSELRNSSSGITLAISGIPNASIAQVVNSRFKGSPITVYRIFLDPTNRNNIGIMGRFQGLVNNYALEEEYDNAANQATNRIVFTCSSAVEILSNKISGRRTNPIDQKQLYPSDLSMDRVNTLASSNFNFGAVIN